MGDIASCVAIGGTCRESHSSVCIASVREVALILLAELLKDPRRGEDLSSTIVEDAIAGEGSRGPLCGT